MELLAYSFDRPPVMQQIVEAAERGAEIDWHVNSGDLNGNAKTECGIQLMADAMREREKFQRYRMLRAREQHGYDLGQARARYDRDTGKGFAECLHAKVFCAPPMLTMGSANWAIASEANRELTCAMIVSESARAPAEAALQGLTRGAVEASSGRTAKAADARATKNGVQRRP